MLANKKLFCSSGDKFCFNWQVKGDELLVLSNHCHMASVNTRNSDVQKQHMVLWKIKAERQRNHKLTLLLPRLYDGIRSCLLPDNWGRNKGRLVTYV